VSRDANAEEKLIRLIGGIIFDHLERFCSPILAISKRSKTQKRDREKPRIRSETIYSLSFDHLERNPRFSLKLIRDSVTNFSKDGHPFSRTPCT